MSIVQILVTVSGLSVIGWIVWYFWLWKGETVSAVVTAHGRQAVDVTVKGGYQPAAIRVQAGQPVRLNFTRREASTCGEAVVLPALANACTCPKTRSSLLRSSQTKPGNTSLPVA